MTLDAGTKLGPYEIVSPLGAGGMGEVYKARDTRLDRTVAVKVLPAHLAENSELRERFEREARAVSGLNHPHICTLHDVGSENGIDFIVMEHLEGETLADRLTRGALPLAEALRYAIQVADALDKAHRAGIVHRDLKPGNVMLTKPGAKLLDFGLAKLETASEPSALSALPTEAKPLTEKGAVLGTFQYMAPEQLEGGTADARSDLFAFGAVLYEMIAGRKAFTGRSQASLISAILRDEPPSLLELEPVAPAGLEHLVTRCLAKDPDERWQTASDVMRELEWIASGGGVDDARPSAAKPAPRRSIIPWIVAAGALLATAFAWFAPESAPERLVRRFNVTPPDVDLAVTVMHRDVAISPDGKRIAYGASSEGRKIFVREMDSLEPILLSDLGSNPRNPFFSPDGEWVGFFDGATLKITPVSGSGGRTVTLCNCGFPEGASWGEDGAIVYASDGLYRVSAAGGEPEALTHPDAATGEGHRWPQILPGGEHVLFTAVNQADSELSEVMALSLQTGETTRVLRGASDARYVSSEKGNYLVYSRGGGGSSSSAGAGLFAAPFDLSQLSIGEEEKPVFLSVMAKGSGAANFDISRDGTLVYTPAGATPGAARTLAWVDRDGNETPLNLDPHPIESARLSPDGSRIAMHLQGENEDIWIHDIGRGTTARLTFHPGADFAPVWTPDGERVVYASSRSGTPNLFWKRADGAGDTERLTTSPSRQAPTSFSPDGRSLVVSQQSDTYLLAMEEPHRMERLMEGAGQPSLSSDGRWIAYTSRETGRGEIYVRPFPDVQGGKWQISTNGGRRPSWSPDGRELVYWSGDSLTAVPIRPGDTFAWGAPQHTTVDGPYVWDVAPDGRYLMVRLADDAESRAEIVVVLNWLSELERRFSAE